MLTGKRILLGVTGSIAAYKAVELLRELTKLWAAVQVVMTEAATKFVAPPTFETLSRQPVLLDMFSLAYGSRIGHNETPTRAAVAWRRRPVVRASGWRLVLRAVSRRA